MYVHCPRRLWIHKKTQNKEIRDYASGTDYHTLLHSMIDLLGRALKSNLSGKVVDTDVLLSRELTDKNIHLCGKIDVLRETEEGYIIQENKSSNPPKDERVRYQDKIQVDAYAFLMEGDKRYKDTPIKSGVILYNDLLPREIKPEPALVEKILDEIKMTLESDLLPEIKTKTKCYFCYYSPLCKILPKEGGLTLSQIRELPEILKLGIAHYVIEPLGVSAS
jgi:CRISPR-associated protein Cas4